MKANLSLMGGLILSALLLWPAAEGRSQARPAQEENVYLIKAFNCTHEPTERLLTGFRVRGMKGIVTALHGIADCKRVTASRKGLLLDQPLSVDKVDVDRDAALLSSPQLKSAEGGLEVAGEVIWGSVGTLKVYGHPYGIGNIETSLSVRQPPLKPLKDLVPAAPRADLMKRRSPNHLIQVLNLQGNILPGHSGAPILDSQGRVVAVANGGLKGGLAGISWAVPFRDIEWKDVGKELEELVLLDPNILFATEASGAAPSEDPESDACERLIRENMAELPAVPDAPSLAGLAGTLNQKRNFKAAICAATRAIRLNSKPAVLAVAYAHRAYAHINMDNPDQAIKDADTAIKIDAGLPIAHAYRCTAYNRIDRYAQAIVDCTEAIRLDPELAVAHANRGGAHLLRKEFDEAIRDTTKAIEINPRYRIAYTNRGRAYEGKKDYAAALKDHSAAIKIEPGNATLYEIQANVYDKLGEKLLAEKDRDTAKKLKQKK